MLLNYPYVFVICSPIKVVPGDVIGRVYDGQTKGIDTDYISTMSTASFSFAGFHIEAGTVNGYEWRLRTHPAGDIVIDYTSAGITGPTELPGDRCTNNS